VELNPEEGVQLYDVAPEAASTVDVPEQIVGELTVTVGIGVTVTSEVFVPEQEPEVPVTV
jgi:ADP-dependent phosphofructokinase/glucokinase